jgi:hypothetical protein
VHSGVSNTRGYKNWSFHPIFDTTYMSVVIVILSVFRVKRSSRRGDGPTTVDVVDPWYVGQEYLHHLLPRQIKLRYLVQCCLLELQYFRQCYLLELRNNVLGVGDDVLHSDEVVKEGWGMKEGVTGLTQDVKLKNEMKHIEGHGIIRKAAVRYVVEAEKEMTEFLD